MQRSSETIGAIAGALAKAQTEIANPEKSLTATIRSPFPGRPIELSGMPRSPAAWTWFAKAWAGTRLPRSKPPRSMIAQALIRLTTVLAHSSGEWVSPDWPVCAVSETAVPHRLGAALTYARRYALFTLVGIAGEDDIDAPELTPPIAPEREAPSKPPRGRAVTRPGIPRLAVDQSEALRDRLLAELIDLATPDEAAKWAHRVLSSKNSLVTEHAEAVEAAFRTSIASFGDAASESTAAEQGPIIEPHSPDARVDLDHTRSISSQALAAGASWPKNSVAATKSIASSCRRSPASSVAAARPTPIICVLPSHGRSA